MRRSPRFRVLILLLAAVLAATPVLAARREPAPAFRQALGVFASLWQALERFLPPLAKGRDTIDPNGTPAPSSVPPGGETDGRGTIDPDGYNVPPEGETDGRSTIDPDG
jgi:hypothetical protein